MYNVQKFLKFTNNMNNVVDIWKNDVKTKKRIYN